MKLDLNVQDKTLKKSLEITYYDCNKSANPTVSHTAYTLGTLKGISTIYEQHNIIWLPMCSRVATQVVCTCTD